jgi:hypothetical protein
MARRKNQPESVRVKCHLSERLRLIRTELFGERGGSEMARRLGLPIRTWYNYEGGVTVPAEVLLRFVELTSVEPMWLLHGCGPKFRVAPPAAGGDNPSSIGALLRTALERLERGEAAMPSPRRLRIPAPDAPGVDAAHLVEVEAPAPNGTSNGAGPLAPADRREWLAARRDCRCVRMEGDAMSPIVADGAWVAFAEAEDDPDALDDKLVVAWVDGQPLVRWFTRSGRYGLLRAENPGHEPNTLLIDLSGPPEDRKVRRVLWISTPH